MPALSNSRRSYVIKSMSGNYWNGAGQWAKHRSEAARWSTLAGASLALDMVAAKNLTQMRMFIVALVRVGEEEGR